MENIIEIVKNNDEVKLKENLKFYNINTEDLSGNNMLHLAIKNKNASICHYLVINSININKQNRSGNTPLHFSILYNQLGIFKFLIKSQANLNIYNEDLETPIMLAMRLGRVKMYQILKESCASLDFKNNHNENYYFYLLYLNNTQIFINETLNVDLYEIENDNKSTLLHKASKIGNKDIVFYILKSNHLLVNKKNSVGETPIFNAVRRHHKDIINILLNHHALIDIKNVFDEEIKDITSKSFYKEIKEITYLPFYLNYIENYKLHISVIKEDIDGIKYNYSIINKNKKDVYGYTPYDYAIKYNYLKISKLVQ